jgi:hypothetical protein
LNTSKPLTFFVSDTGGCIGRFWWVNTVQRPAEWVACAYPFPLWGTSLPGVNYIGAAPT